MKSFAVQLTEARKKLGLTQELLGSMVGVSRPTVSHWEKANVLPDLETVRKLSSALHCDFILTDESGKGNAEITEFGHFEVDPSVWDTPPALNRLQQQALSPYPHARVVDVSLHVNGAAVQELNGALALRLPLPEELRGKTLRGVQLDENGNTKELCTKIHKNGCVSLVICTLGIVALYSAEE